MEHEATGEPSEQFVDAFHTKVQANGDSWLVMSFFDGEWRTVSRHPTPESAYDASRQLNSSANRDPKDLQP